MTIRHLPHGRTLLAVLSLALLLPAVTAQPAAAAGGPCSLASDPTGERRRRLGLEMKRDRAGFRGCRLDATQSSRPTGRRVQNESSAS